MKIQKLLVVLFLFLSLVPAWYVNKWLQKTIQPRRSFGLLLLYMIACFALVFAYSFLVVFVIFKMFPLPKR